MLHQNFPNDYNGCQSVSAAPRNMTQHKAIKIGLSVLIF